MAQQWLVTLESGRQVTVFTEGKQSPLKLAGYSNDRAMHAIANPQPLTASLATSIMDCSCQPAGYCVRHGGSI